MLTLSEINGKEIVSEEKTTYVCLFITYNVLATINNPLTHSHSIFRFNRSEPKKVKLYVQGQIPTK